MPFLVGLYRINFQVVIRVKIISNLIKIVSNLIFFKIGSGFPISNIVTYKLLIVWGASDYFMSSTIIFNAKSKKTIRGLTFCVMSRSANESSSIMPMTLRSLIKGEKRVEKSRSLAAK